MHPRRGPSRRLQHHRRRRDDRADVARELGFIPVPSPAGPVAGAARAIAKLPALPAAEWVEAISHPAIMDTSKAKKKLKWRPRFTSAEALRDTLPS